MKDATLTTLPLTVIDLWLTSHALPARGRTETHAIDDVVETTFQQPQQVFTGRAFHPIRFGL